MALQSQTLKPIRVRDAIDRRSLQGSLRGGELGVLGLLGILRILGMLVLVIHGCGGRGLWNTEYGIWVDLAPVFFLFGLAR